MPLDYARGTQLKIKIHTQKGVYFNFSLVWLATSELRYIEVSRVEMGGIEPPCKKLPLKTLRA